MRRLLKSLALSTIAGMLGAVSAGACMFHPGLPELTITDRLRWADTIVLGRDDGNFGYEAVVALRGDISKAKIPFLADSSTVRKMALNHQDAVLFSHDPKLGVWHRVAYVNGAMRQVVNDLLEQMPQWPADYDEDRFRFFADLHDHPDATIRQMAHLELDKAPYDLLRTLDLRLDPKTIIGRLRDPSAIDWIPFNYLLLGISGSEVARETLYRAIGSADGSEFGFLGAAATATVEIDGRAGLEWLERLFLDDHTEPIGNVEKVVQAIAIHNKVGDTELRAHTRSTLSRLVSDRPELGSIVAKHLADGSDWSLADTMEKLLKSRRLQNSSDIIVVSTYLSLARLGRPIE